MVVRPSGGFHGTIGGGALEWAALEAAQAALKQGRGPALRRSLALGPELAQCCGGRVEWRIETFDRRDLEDLAALAAAEGRGPATIRAAVGRGREDRAKARAGTARGGPDRRPSRTRRAGPSRSAKAPAPSICSAPAMSGARWRWRWRRCPSRCAGSTRAARPFRPTRPANVALIHAPEPAAELANAPDGALIVVMTHSHALDLEIVAEALRAERFGYVGLIGSATKRARFLSQMRAAGLPEAALAKLVCPIGLPGIEGKDPAVIAASTAAQLLMAGERAEKSAGGAEPKAGPGARSRLASPRKAPRSTSRFGNPSPTQSFQMFRRLFLQLLSSRNIGIVREVVDEVSI